MKVLVTGLVVVALATGLEAGGLGMARGAGGGLRYGDRRCRGGGRGRGRWNSRLYHNRIRCRLNLGHRNRGAGGMAVGDFVPNNNNNNPEYEDDNQEEPCIGICLHLKMQREAAEKAEKEKERQEEKQRRRQERREARRQMEREAGGERQMEGEADGERQMESIEDPKLVESEDAAELERQLQRQKPKTAKLAERELEAEEALGRLLQRKEKVKQKLTKDMEDDQEEEQINGIKNMEESPRERPEPCVGICYLKKLQRIAAEEARANQRKRNVDYDPNYDYDYHRMLENEYLKYQ